MRTIHASWRYGKRFVQPFESWGSHQGVQETGLFRKRYTVSQTTRGSCAPHSGMPRARPMMPRRAARGLRVTALCNVNVWNKKLSTRLHPQNISGKPNLIQGIQHAAPPRECLRKCPPVDLFLDHGGEMFFILLRQVWLRDQWWWHELARENGCYDPRTSGSRRTSF